MGKHKLQIGFKSTKCYPLFGKSKATSSRKFALFVEQEKSWVIIFNYTIRVLVRWWQKERPEPCVETLYLKGLYERLTLPSGNVEHKYYVGNTVVIDSTDAKQSKTLYTHKDHLGSTVTVTDANGSVVQHINYDAWGKQNRFYTSSSLVSLLNQQSPVESKGYTGHKEISDLGIIHMNGRIYDPTLGRFVQADPFIQFPNNSQSYNRYSYVLNNPMSFTDPTGYFSFSGFLKQSYKRTMMIDGRYTAHKFTGRNPALHSIGVTALNFIPYFGPLAAAHANFDHALVNTGSLRAAFTSGATSLAISGVFYGIGQAFDASSGFWQTGGAAHIGAHALAGGVISDLQGGNFGHGFWSAGITKAANVNGIVGTQQGVAWDALRIAVAATIGGTVSKLTGGKFANGATTAAFAQAFNGNQQAKKADSLKETPEQRKLREAGDVEGYYKARAAAGDGYAERALMVVQDQCSSWDSCLMASANFGLNGTAFINGVDIDMQEVRLLIMNKHAEFVEADNLGVPGLLNPRQIAEYHHQVFNGLGLPNATFGGTPLTGQLWEANISRYYVPFFDWCGGCDTQ